MRIKIKKNAIKIIIIFIILMENCFYLIDVEAIHISGAFAYSDIWLGILICYFGYQFIKYRKIKTNFDFGIPIFILIILVFVSAYQQNVLTGQSIWLGIRPQRNYLIILLTYFPLKKMFEAGKFKVDELLDSLMSVGVFSAILYLIQKMSIEQIQFLHVTIGERDGARFYIDSTLVQIAAMISIYKFSKDYKGKHLFSLLICIAYEIFVSQGRLEIIAVVLTITIGFLMSRKKNGKKVMGILCMVIAAVVFLNSSYAKDLWEAIVTMSTATAAQGNTMEIRNIGKARYLVQLAESLRTLLFGCGYPNSLYTPAAEKAGFNLGIGLIDNGVFGFAYIYGLIGIITLAILVMKFIIKSFRLYRIKGNTIFLMYIVLNICLGYNIIFWYWKADGTFLMVLMLCMIEYVSKGILQDYIGEGQKWIKEK